MNLHEASEAIRAILDQIPEHLLPQPDEREGDDFAHHEKYGKCYWFGGHGYYVGACRDGQGKSIPNDHRRSAISGLFEREFMQRLEDAHWENEVAR